MAVFFSSNNVQIDSLKKLNTSPDLKSFDEEDSKEAVLMNCDSATTKQTRFVGFSRELRSPRLNRRNNPAFSDTKFFSTESCQDSSFYADDERCEPPISDQIFDIQEEYETIGM